MASKVTLLLLNTILFIKCITGLAADVGNEEDENDWYGRNRILQGTPVQLGECPYMVYARSDPINNKKVPGHICSGSILTEKWVLTAAQCYRVYTKYNVKIDQVRTIVIAGSTNINEFTNTTQFTTALRHVIMDMDKSKQYSMSFNNDVALIELEEAFEFNGYVGPITVALTYPYGKKMTCDVIGFGRTKFGVEDNKPMYNTILYRTKGMLDGRSDSCKRRAMNSGYGHLHDWSLGHLCVDPFNASSSPCKGDSGGPMVCEGLLTGICSGRMNIKDVKALCGIEGNYHVFSFYGYYDEWVRLHVPNLPRGRPLIGKVREKSGQNDLARLDTELHMDGGDMTAQCSLAVIVLAGCILHIANLAI